METRMGLILTGGAARGAYQVGVLKGLFHLIEEMGISWPFQTLVSTSAGAINGSYLLANSDWNNPQQGIASLESMWMSLDSSKIYKTGWGSVVSNGASWLTSLTLLGGGTNKKGKTLSLLDPLPLYELVKQNIDFKKLNRAVLEGPIDTFSMNALSYCNGLNKTFFYSRLPHKNWKRLKRESVKTLLGPKHLLASAAIPIIFPPMKIEGRFHCDGSIRDYAPLSPGIHFGCEKLLVIGTRMFQHESFNCIDVPSTAKVINTLIDSLMQDSIENDIEKCHLINHFLNSGDNLLGLKLINPLLIRPRKKISEIAFKHFESLPGPIKYMVKGLGSGKDVAELTSYILFEKDYIKELIALGENDLSEQKDEIREFLL